MATCTTYVNINGQPLILNPSAAFEGKPARHCIDITQPCLLKVLAKHSPVTEDVTRCQSWKAPDATTDVPHTASPNPSRAQDYNH
jgi:hypothetical protein